MIELVRIGIGQRVLILGLVQAAADGDVLRGLQIKMNALDPGKLRVQSRDHLVGADIALTEWFQGNEQTPLIGSRDRPAGADLVADRGDRRVFQDDIDRSELALSHGWKRGVL